MRTLQTINIGFIIISWLYWGIFYIGIRLSRIGNLFTNQTSFVQVFSSQEMRSIIVGYFAVMLCGTAVLYAQMRFRRLFPTQGMSLKKQLTRLVAVVVIAAVILAIIVSMAYYFIIFPNDYQRQPIFSSAIILQYFSTTAVLVVYILPSVALYHFAVLYYEFVAVTQERLEMQSIIKESEYERLKNQLNPHFLFNALNSIKALIREEPAKAGEAIAVLSDLLRSFLQTNERSLVPLQTDIAIVDDYIALERLRLGDDLHFSWKIADRISSILVPTLLVHTLVENAIKHGIGKLPFGGDIVVRIDIDTAAQTLYIWTRNAAPRTASFPSLQLEHNHHADKPAIGLRNLQRRLTLLYGEKASIQYSIEMNNNVRTADIVWANVRITLPVTVAPELAHNSMPGIQQPLPSEEYAARSYRG